MKAIHNLFHAIFYLSSLFVNPKLKELFDKWKQFTTYSLPKYDGFWLFVNPKLKELFDKWKQFTTYVSGSLYFITLFVNPKLKELFDKWKQFTTNLPFT